MLFASGLVPWVGGQEPPDTNYDEARVPAYVLPDPLVSGDGRAITDSSAWYRIRRPELLEAFAQHVYGRTPRIQVRVVATNNAPDAVVFDGLGLRRQLRLRLLEAESAPWIDLLLYVPRGRSGPAPVFLGLNYGNQGVDPDPGIVPSRNAVSRPGEQAARWPLKTLLSRGYAVASFHGGDLELDRHGSGCRYTEAAWREGIRAWVLRRDGRNELAADEWGSLGAWAWGLSRVLDHLRTDPGLDGARVGVFGHSRTGKAALWAGAQDERFALVYSNNSGQGGAALARRRYGESVAASYALSGSWYCRNYQRYGNHEAELPVDAHELIALLAPRPVYVASAEQDRWADPRGEFLAAYHADPVYALFGRPGLGVSEVPPVHQPVGGTLGYHLRAGDHEITAYDWERVLDFADRHLPGPSTRVHLVPQEPARITRIEPGVLLLDYERVAFGNLRITSPAAEPRPVVVRFGEARSGGRILRTPPGSVRYAEVSVTLPPGVPRVVAPPPDRRSTEVDTPRHPPAVLTPLEWGVVLPFRWVEIEGWPGDLEPGQVLRQAAFARDWDADAAAFACSDEMLNQVWALSRDTIHATTFAGLYVDGDRERIPYEADAYLNQLSHHAVEGDAGMARDTFDWLLRNPTWPTEWAPSMMFLAHADFRHTGDLAWLAARYEDLKSKLLPDRQRPDGLIDSGQDRWRRLDLVDWPAGERDGFVFTPINTVVNAFHVRALGLMAELAGALGRQDEAASYTARERATRKVFLDRLWDPSRGLFRDGEGTDHTSAHANLFPLAFDLVPDGARQGVADWLLRRGMVCSVYAAQYLLEGLFQQGTRAASGALRLMTAPGDRSWRHMVESGTTLTWEAWDQRYKPNQDWNHAWGAAPANLLPRFVLGVQALEPGWTVARIRPHPGELTFARGKVPTPRGAIQMEWQRGERFRVRLHLPEGFRARVELPATPETAGVVLLDPSGPRSIPARRVEDRWILDTELAGDVTLEVR